MTDELSTSLAPKSISREIPKNSTGPSFNRVDFLDQVHGFQPPSTSTASSRLSAAPLGSRDAIDFSSIQREQARSLETSPTPQFLNTPSIVSSPSQTAADVSMFASLGSLLGTSKDALLSIGAFLCSATGITGIYEGIRDGDWKKVALGACQLVGTGMAVMTGAGLGMIVAGAVLQNAGSIFAALSSGNPAAILGAVAAVGLTIVISKYGNVVAQKIMNKFAPVSEKVLQEGMLKVGEGLGKKVGEEIILEKGAEQITKMGVEAGQRAASVASQSLEAYAGPAVEAAKRTFGAGSTQVAEVAKTKIAELSTQALTPELNAVMSKLGITDRVAAVVQKEILEKAASAGVLGQAGFGGGKILSHLGLGNTALKKAIQSAVPELEEEAVGLLAKNLCRAVQQGGFDELLKESLTNGITKGVRASLHEVLEKPTQEAFKRGMTASVGEFIKVHGLTEIERRAMMEGLDIGFERAYSSVLRDHVKAGVDKAFERDERRNAVASATNSESKSVASSTETAVSKGGEDPKRKAAQYVSHGTKLNAAALSGVATQQVTERLANGGTVIKTFQQIEGKYGPEWHLVAVTEHVPTTPSVKPSEKPFGIEDRNRVMKV